MLGPSERFDKYFCSILAPNCNVMFDEQEFPFWD